MNTTTTEAHYENRPADVFDRPPSLLDNVIVGGTAGFIAGICVAVSAMLHAAIAGPEEAWLPMKLVAGTWGGVDVLIGAGGTIAIGLATHLGTSAGWGVAFGLVASRLNAAMAVVLGALWSGLVWIVMTWGFVPWLNPTMAPRINMQPYWWWWLLHIIYGVVLGITFVALRGAILSPRQRQA